MLAFPTHFVYALNPYFLKFSRYLLMSAFPIYFVVNFSRRIQALFTQIFMTLAYVSIFDTFYFQM